MKEDENFFNKFRSAIPPHLSPEEHEEWVKETERSQQDYERRKREGFYPEQGKQGIVSKIISKFNYRANKKWDDPANYGP